MSERWLPVPDFPNYEISNHGRIRNVIRGTFVKPVLNSYKSNAQYWRVNLWKNNERTPFYVHRLVAMVFVDGYDEELVVDHKDINPDNNKHLKVGQPNIAF